MDGDVNRPSESSTMGEAFEEQCPYYIAMGMSYELYWDGPSDAAKAYRKADRLRQERMNVDAWLHGAYFYSAIADLVPAINPFSKNRPKNYMDKPFELNAPKPVTQEDEEKRILKSRAIMEAFAAKFNQDFEAKQKLKQQGGETDANH